MGEQSDTRPLIVRLLAILVLVQASFSMIGPLLGPLKEGFRVSNQEIALLVASAGLARLIFDLPAGSLVSRGNRRTLLIAASGITALGGLFCALDVGFGFLLAARALTGVGSTIVVAAALAQLTEAAPANRRGVVLGSYEATFWLGSALGSAASGWIASTIGWPWSFAFGCGCGLMALAVALTLPSLGSERRGATVLSGGYRAAFAVGNVRLLGTLAFILAVTFHRFGFSNTLAPLFAVTIGLDPAQIGAAQATTSLLGVIAVLAGGHFGDRVGRPRVAASALFGLGAVTLAYLLVADFNGFFAVSAALGLAGFGTGMGPALIADSLPSAHRARGIAMFRLLTDLSQVTAPVLVGFALDHSGNAPVLVGLAILLVSGAILLMAGFGARVSESARATTG